MKNIWLLSLALLAFPVVAVPVQVGPTKNGSWVVPTKQVLRPAGQSVTFHGRPVDLAVTPDGRFIYSKDDRGVIAIDARSMKVIQELATGGASLHGMALTADGRKLYSSDAGSHVHEFIVGADGKLSEGRNLALDRDAYACGLALTSDGSRLLVCQNKLNNLAVLNLATAVIERRIQTGIAPYAVKLSPNGQIAYVSNWGGHLALPGERTALSAGTPTPVDARGVALSGSVSFIDLASGTEIAQVNTGRHAADLALTQDGRALFVANANDDTVSVIDTAARKVCSNILVRPEPDMPYGSASNALALSQDERTLFVANGGNNAVAVVDVSAIQQARQKSRAPAWSGWMVHGLKPGDSVVKGFIPSGWYPGALARYQNEIFVANVKGLGSRAGNGQYDKAYLGSIDRITIPDRSQLSRYTVQVRAQSLIPSVLQAYRPARPRIAPVPAPERVGEPSPIKHIIYVIKENRTYDQLFGDMKQANGDPALVQFGRNVTPNQHKIAEDFVLLDNYYCNGVNSADGHSWCDEGNCTDHLEKAFGGFSRSYTFGNDPLTYSSTGFIWDNVMAHGHTFHDFGEFGSARSVPPTSWKDIYDDFIAHGEVTRCKFMNTIGVERVKEHADPGYPGWDLGIPDVVRMGLFLRQFKEFDANPNGSWYDFTIVYLPSDHTGGPPTPRAMVADNDLAVGRLVDAVSHSRIWPTTALFIIEDDPQSGLDHVDGHRSICLVASPYTRRHAVVSDFYNQCSVLHTMEEILGCPPMNQMDAMAPLMSACFTSKPDLTPYTAVPNEVPLDEMPVRRAKTGYQQRLMDRVRQINFSKPDDQTPADEDALNRYLWHSTRGWNALYPAKYAGAHGRGLAALGLALDGAVTPAADMN